MDRPEITIIRPATNAAGMLICNVPDGSFAIVVECAESCSLQIADLVYVRNKYAHQVGGTASGSDRDRTGISLRPVAVDIYIKD